MAFGINYDAILRRIKDVSVIDTETIYFVEMVDDFCPDCTWDPISRASTDPFCPTCNGIGKLRTEVRKPVLASVDRGDGIRSEFEPGGRIERGSVVVTVHESQLREVGYEPLTDWISVVDHIEIMGEKWYIAEGDSVIPQTLQGIVYEVIFHLSRKPLQ